MSDNPSMGFTKFVPGFDFLQNIAKGASQSMPQMPSVANWIAPTLNVEELDKRIGELKAVHFWLDQNSKALAATIQALEVQKMTLATLKGMNLNMSELAEAMRMKTSDAVAAGMQKAADTAEAVTGAARAARGKAAAKGESGKPDGAEAKPAASSGGVVDPLQWWGALTQQFQQIAADALKDVARNSAMDSARQMATGMVQDAAKGASEAVRVATGGATGAATRTAGAKGATPRKARKTPARRAASDKT